MLWFCFLFISSLSGSYSQVDPTNCTACSPLYCTNETCELGSFPHPLCECCDICYRGEGERCGNYLADHEEICVEGLICEEWYDPGLLLPFSYCIKPVDNTIDPSNCIACTEYYSCTTETCEVGSVPHPYCDCCTVCLKGEFEACGGHPYLPDICAGGLTCVPIALPNPVATCNNISSSEKPHCPHCSPSDCPKGPCLYQTIPNSRCECCPVCLKGLGESCGGKSLLPNVCVEGLICAGNFFSPKSKGTCSENGTAITPSVFPPGNHAGPRGPRRPKHNRGKKGRHG